MSQCSLSLYFYISALLCIRWKSKKQLETINLISIFFPSSLLVLFVGLFPLNSVLSHFLPSAIFILKKTNDWLSSKKCFQKNRMDMKYCRGRECNFVGGFHKSIENNWKCSFFRQRTNWMTLVQFKLLFLLLLVQKTDTTFSQAERVSSEMLILLSLSTDKLRFHKWRIKLFVNEHCETH